MIFGFEFWWNFEKVFVFEILYYVFGWNFEEGEMFEGNKGRQAEREVLKLYLYFYLEIFVFVFEILYLKFCILYLPCLDF